MQEPVCAAVGAEDLMHFHGRWLGLCYRDLGFGIVSSRSGQQCLILTLFHYFMYIIDFDR